MKKRLFVLFAFCALSGGLFAVSLEKLAQNEAETAPSTAAVSADTLGHADSPALKAIENLYPIPQITPEFAVLYDLPRKGFAGQFLISHFAQSQYDWEAANSHLDKVLESDPENEDLLRRSMILNMGEGNLDKAASRATKLLETDTENSLAWLILVVNNLRRNEAEKAMAHIEKMPEGDISDFMRPMLKGWVMAAQGKLAEPETLQATTVHMYSGALMALYLKKEKQAADFAAQIVEIGRISPHDAERAGDIFAVTGANKEALMLYQGTLSQDPGNTLLQRKITALNEGKDKIKDQIKAVAPDMRVGTPAHGAAVVLYDMARILYQEQSDSSAKLFAQMAIALHPEHEDSQLLIANALARNGRYDEAIQFFSSITPGHSSYLSVQRHIADLMEEAGRRDEALALLRKLFAEHNDVESLIKIGDLYRNTEEYKQALAAYNEAASKIGETIPEQYWHLLYARGMTYEREGDWTKAEIDLKAALAYRPDHPYLLNYLGYGWADQGLNLEESLNLVERAAALRPSDAYIVDSLGWVLYMMARYEESIPHLEKAVELLPYDPTLNDHLGDAYWQVGRKLEARFQWERAINNSSDQTLKTAVQEKLHNGLEIKQAVREAQTKIDNAVTTP